MTAQRLEVTTAGIVRLIVMAMLAYAPIGVACRPAAHACMACHLATVQYDLRMELPQ